jgi:hypothetical protein
VLSSRLGVTAWIALAVFVAALSVAPRASAQGSGASVIPRPTSTTAGSISIGSSIPWGTRMEHWLAAGVALALGAATVAVGTGLQRYAVDLNTHAQQLNTTQADAAASVNTARDYLLAAEVMWTVGAAMAAIGLTWVIVLSFSTPVATAPPEAAATTPTASLRVTPLGVTLEGVF